MLEQKTIIDQIELTRGGVIQIRFGLLTLKDGVEVSAKWHRTSIEPGIDVAAVLDAVNADITTRPTLMAEAINKDCVPFLKSICAVVHTPEVVKAYKERQSADAAELTKET